MIASRLNFAPPEKITPVPKKYIGDSMLYGLSKFMTKAGVDFVTATRAIKKDDDSSIAIPDRDLFRYVLEKRFQLVPREGADDYTIITSDKELPAYCRAFGIDCIFVEKPETRAAFKETATNLVEKLKPVSI